MKEVLMRNAILGLVFSGILICFLVSYFIKVYRLLGYIRIFNKPGDYGYEKINGVINPADNAEPENYLQQVRISRGFMNFLFGGILATFSETRTVSTVAGDVNGSPLFKTSIGDINRPFNLQLENFKKVPVKVVGCTDTQLKLNDNAFLVGRWENDKFVPVIASNKEKINIGAAEVVGIIIGFALLCFALNMIFFQARVLFG